MDVFAMEQIQPSQQPRHYQGLSDSSRLAFNKRFDRSEVHDLGPAPPRIPTTDIHCSGDQVHIAMHLFLCYLSAEQYSHLVWQITRSPSAHQSGQKSPQHRNILKQNVQGEPDAVHSKAGVSELGRGKLHEELLQVGEPNMVVALRTLIALRGRAYIT